MKADTQQETFVLKESKRSFIDCMAYATLMIATASFLIPAALAIILTMSPIYSFSTCVCIFFMYMKYSNYKQLKRQTVILEKLLEKK